MRITSVLLVIMMIFTSAALAQPVKKAYQNAVFVDEPSAQEISNAPLQFLPEQAMLATDGSGILHVARTKPGIAMLSSAILPGAGQAMNGKWGRAAVYFVTEALSVAYYFERNATAKRNEEAYERYGNQNWSVLAYAQWLVDYSQANGLENGYEQLATQLAQLNSADQNPDYSNTTNDWRKVNLTTLRTVEVETRFVHNSPQRCATIASNICSEFSHVVQDYGSQQYYELMSKYYQFSPGWQDFHNQRIAEGDAHQYQYTWDPNMITADFVEGRNRAEEFNNNYRQAGNILKFLLVNHVVSAFDAFFTVKLKNSRIETQATMIGEESVSLIWHF